MSSSSATSLISPGALAFLKKRDLSVMIDDAAKTPLIRLCSRTYLFRVRPTDGKPTLAAPAAHTVDGAAPCVKWRLDTRTPKPPGRRCSAAASRTNAVVEGDQFLLAHGEEALQLPRCGTRVRLAAVDAQCP